MIDSGIRTRHLRFPNRGDTRYFYYTRHQLCRPELSASWATSGKRKNNTDYRIEYFPFEKKFSTKNKNTYFQYVKIGILTLALIHSFVGFLTIDVVSIKF